MSTETAPRPPRNRRASGPKAPALRSRVGNGNTLLAGADLNSAEYREYRDVVDDLTAHLGGSPSAVERAIVEELAGLIVWCRRARLALLTGGKFDIGPFTTAVNAVRRLGETLGLRQAMKDVTLTLEDLAAEEEAEEEAARAAEAVKAAEGEP